MQFENDRPKNKPITMERPTRIGVQHVSIPLSPPWTCVEPSMTKTWRTSSFIHGSQCRGNSGPVPACLLVWVEPRRGKWDRRDENWSKRLCMYHRRPFSFRRRMSSLGRWRRSHGEVDLDLQTMSSVKAKTSACCKIARRHSSLRDRELSRYIFYFRSIDVIAPFRCFRIFPSAFGRPSFTFQNS
jgi:hypothetical protein